MRNFSAVVVFISACGHAAALPATGLGVRAPRARAANDIWSSGFNTLNWNGTSWQSLPVAHLGVEVSRVTAKDVWAVECKGLIMRKSK